MSVVTDPNALDFTEPNAVIVTGNPTGTAHVDMRKYALLSGRGGTANALTLTMDVGGNGLIQGSSASTGSLQLNANAAGTGILNLNANICSLTGAGAAEELRFWDAAAGNYVGVAAPTTVTAAYGVKLPTAQGAGFLTNNGSGTLSWVTTTTVAATTTTATTTTTARPNMPIQEDTVSVVTDPNALDFTEPDATIVTGNPTGTAHVNMSGYPRYAGRSGAKTLTLSTTAGTSNELLGSSGSAGTETLQIQVNAAQTGGIFLDAPNVSMSPLAGTGSTFSFQAADGNAINLTTPAAVTGSSPHTYTLPAILPSNSGDLLGSTVGGVMAWKHLSGDVSADANDVLTVQKINGNAIDPNSPAAGNFLVGDGTKWQSERVVVRADSRAACDGTTDDTTALTNLLVDATGGTLVLPANAKGTNAPCKMLVTGPAASGTKFTIPLSTSIVGEDIKAGIVLSGKKCSGGTYDGLACTGDPNCYGGGTCVGTAFAPTGGSAYGLFNTTVASIGSTLRNLSIYTQGLGGGFTCAGGTKVGQPCKNTCNGGNQAGKLCLVDGDCPSGTCTLDTACTGGTCNGRTGSPSGAGKTNLVDFTNVARDGVLDDVVVWDLGQADWAFKLGPAQNASHLVVSTYTNTWATPVVPTSVLPPGPIITAWSTSAPAVGTVVLAGDPNNYVPMTILKDSLLRCDTGACVNMQRETRVQGNHLIASSAATGLVAFENLTGTATDKSIITGNRLDALAAPAGSIGIDVLPGAIHDGSITNNLIYRFDVGLRLAGVGVNVAHNTILFPTTATVKIGNDGSIGGLPQHSSLEDNFLGNIGAIKGILAVDPNMRCSDQSSTKYGQACNGTDSCTDCPFSHGCTGGDGTSGTCDNTNPHCCAYPISDDINLDNNWFVGNTGPLVDLSAWTSTRSYMRGVVLKNSHFMGGSTVLATTTCVAVPTDTTAAGYVTLNGNQRTSDCGTPYSGALSYTKGRHRHSMTLYYNGAISTGQVPTQLSNIPSDVENCVVTNSNFSAATTSAATSTVSPARCQEHCSGADPNALTFFDVYASGYTLPANTHAVAGGVPTAACTASNRPWSCCTGAGTPSGCGGGMLNSIAGGDIFIGDFVGAGASLANGTLTMTYTCDN